MKKIHTEKIRATFYIDKRLYQLLKRCSAIEEVPMSSIIENDILEKRLEKYSYPTPEAWEGYYRFEFPEIMEQLEHEQQWEAYSKSSEGLYESEKLHIKKQQEQGMITKEKADSLLQAAEKKRQLALEQEELDAEREKQKLKERWEKAIREIPIE
jgi:hypothetical protein